MKIEGQIKRLEIKAGPRKAQTPDKKHAEIEIVCMLDSETAQELYKLWRGREKVQIESRSDWGLSVKIMTIT